MALNLIRRNFFLEFIIRNSLQGAAVTLAGEGILCFAAYLPAFCHLLRSQSHAISNSDILIVRKNGWIHRNFISHHRHHTHALGTCRNHHVSFAETNSVCRESHCLQPGRTEAVNGQARYSVRQASQQQCNSRHVHALLSFRHGTAGDDIDYCGRVK